MECIRLAWTAHAAQGRYYRLALYGHYLISLRGAGRPSPAGLRLPRHTRLGSARHSSARPQLRPRALLRVSSQVPAWLRPLSLASYFPKASMKSMQCSRPSASGDDIHNAACNAQKKLFSLFR